MEFAEAREIFFQPREDARPVEGSSPARRLRDALEPLAMVSVWSDPATERLSGAGLDFLAGYVGGRGAALGDPDGAVVAASFGVFEPGMIADLWRGARDTASVADLRTAVVAAGGEALRDALGATPTAEVDAAVGTLREGIEAAGGADVVGRPLFAGLRAQPWPEDPHGRLWHAAQLLREHRGDAHLGACTAAGLDGLESNVLTELRAGFALLEYTATRGWSQEAMDAAVARLEKRGLVSGGALTGEGRRLRDGVEEATDRAEQTVVDALGDRLDPLVAVLEGWSDAVIARGWFPPDPYKRAAG